MFGSKPSTFLGRIRPFFSRRVHADLSGNLSLVVRLLSIPGLALFPFSLRWVEILGGGLRYHGLQRRLACVIGRPKKSRVVETLGRDLHIDAFARGMSGAVNARAERPILTTKVPWICDPVAVEQLRSIP